MYQTRVTVFHLDEMPMLSLKALKSFKTAVCAGMSQKLLLTYSTPVLKWLIRQSNWKKLSNIKRQKIDKYE